MCVIALFNAVLIRLVAQVKISLLLKIQKQEHDYLSKHGCGSVGELRSVIMMMPRVDPRAEGGARM